MESMDSPNNRDLISSICRICGLSEDRERGVKLFDLFGDSLDIIRLRILKFFDIQKNEDPRLPSKICSICNRQIHSFEMLTIRCETMNHIIRRSLSASSAGRDDALGDEGIVVVDANGEANENGEPATSTANAIEERVIANRPGTSQSGNLPERDELLFGMRCPICRKTFIQKKKFNLHVSDHFSEGSSRRDMNTREDGFDIQSQSKRAEKRQQDEAENISDEAGTSSPVTAGTSPPEEACSLHRTYFTKSTLALTDDSSDKSSIREIKKDHRKRDKCVEAKNMSKEAGTSYDYSSDGSSTHEPQKKHRKRSATPVPSHVEMERFSI